MEELENIKDNIKDVEEKDEAFKIDKKTLGVYKTSFVIEDIESYILNT